MSASRLHEFAAGLAERRPDDTAVVMGDERLTYAELESEANQLARVLVENGLGRGDRVCLFVPKSPAAIVAMHATLKAGGVYVPIDLASPAARVAKIVAAAEPGVVLVDQTAAELLDGVIGEGAMPGGASIGSVDSTAEGAKWKAAFTRAASHAEADTPFDRGGSAHDIAHLLFTSGSTGTPKGVVIKHSNVIAFVSWATSYFGTRETDRISGHPPLHFDLSTFDIYATLSAGAELHLVTPELNLLPHKLAAFIRDSELTQWFSVPSIMTYIAKLGALRKLELPALERVIWCGEVLPTPILIHWMERIPHATFTNLYGPTEATIASSYYTVPERPRRETDPIPIGTACAGEELLVLDSELRPVQAGEIGDLYIAGVGLSPGYWRDEEKTAAAFVADPRSADGAGTIYRTGDLAKTMDDGLVYFLGRADSQIKSRGYRIELGEIETALNALDVLSECAVVGIETGGFEGTAICCAYASRSKTTEPSELRERLSQILPSYMLPSRWLPMEALPKNVNGKIDRRALREAFEHRELAA